MKFLLIVAAAVLAVTTAKPYEKSAGFYTGPKLSVAAPSIGSYAAVALPTINIAPAPIQKSYVANNIPTYIAAPLPTPPTTARPTAKSYTSNVVVPTLNVAAPTAKSYISAPAPKTHVAYIVPPPPPPPPVVVPAQKSYSIPAPLPVRPPAHKSYSVNTVSRVAIASPHKPIATTSVGQKSYGANTGPVIVAPQRISYAQVPQVATADASSTRYHIQDELGQYNYGYATADGQAKTEIRGIDGSVAGKYSYIDPDGKHVVMSYVADDDGFRVAGNNIPVAPEMPEELAQEYRLAHSRLAAAKVKEMLGQTDDGEYKEEDHDDGGDHDEDGKDDGADDGGEDDGGDDGGDDKKPTTLIVGTLHGTTGLVQTVSAPVQTILAAVPGKSIDTLNAAATLPVATQVQTTLPVKSINGVQQLSAPTSGATVPVSVPLPSVPQIYSVVGKSSGVAPQPVPVKSGYAYTA